MFEQQYKRVEKMIVIFMVVGIFALFQPWFQSVVSLFDGLSPETDLVRLYSREVAPTIFRYGFYLLLLSTVAFTVISHYTPADLLQAMAEKGTILTWVLVVLPAIIGFTILGNLSVGAGTAATIGILAFICGVAIWNWKRWGVIGYVLTSFITVILAAMSRAQMGTAVLNLALAFTILALLWPQREKLT